MFATYLMTDFFFLLVGWDIKMLHPSAHVPGPTSIFRTHCKRLPIPDIKTDLPGTLE